MYLIRYWPGEGGLKVEIFRSFDFVQFSILADHTHEISCNLSSSEKIATVSVLLICGGVAPAATAPSKSKFLMLMVCQGHESISHTIGIHTGFHSSGSDESTHQFKSAAYLDFCRAGDADCREFDDKSVRDSKR
jgi:hypothetical protein